jgi:radical SAM superfamily enzyme YgiQ (UPF0313 family)
MMGGFGQCYPPECEVKVPPIDIPYTAAVLRVSKIEVRVIDCLGSGYSVEDLAVELRKQPVKLVFIRTSTSTFTWDAEVARSLKEILGVTIVFFGPHINVAAEEVLRIPSIDAVIFDEPEYTVRDISLRGFKDTPGVWYKEKGAIIKNAKRAMIMDPDGLPFPAWDLLPYGRYNVGNLMPKAGATLFMLTSRGCPYTCNYCPYPVAQGHKYRKRSPQNVLDEFDYLAKAFNAQNIVIRDAEFTLDRKRIVEICEGLIKSKCGVSWRCETRADTLDVALVELMHKAGCSGINMGIESRSEEVCKKVERIPLKPPETMDILRRCKELGIHTFCFFIAGLPGDNWSTISETIGYAIALDPGTAQFTVATPYLGTGLHQWASENKFVESTENSSVTGFESMIRNEHLSSEEILWLRSEAQRLVDIAHKRKMEGMELELKETEPSASFMRSLGLMTRRRKDLKRVIIYGVKGLSVPLLKKAGFDFVAIVDEDLQGKTLSGMAVLSPEFIKVGKPDAILVSDDRLALNIRYDDAKNAVLFAAGKEERFWMMKKATKRIKRKIREWSGGGIS